VGLFYNGPEHHTDTGQVNRVPVVNAVSKNNKEATQLAPKSQAQAMKNRPLAF